jgi:NTP pyrophosphatase (non-canonical NTP hydrolase)
LSANDRQIGGTHYQTNLLNGKQHWDIMWELYGEAWFVGAVTKYLTRYKLKEGLTSLDKALHYMDKLIECCDSDNFSTVSSTRRAQFLVARRLLFALLTLEADLTAGRHSGPIGNYAEQIFDLLLPKEEVVEKKPKGWPGTVKEPIIPVQHEDKSMTREEFIQSLSSRDTEAEKSFRQIQQEIGKWAKEQFGENCSKDVNSVSYGHPLGPVPALLGVMEELGELSRVVLRLHQGRGLPPTEAQEAKEDAVADLLVFLCDFATREKIDLQLVLNKVWAKVCKRNQATWEADKAKESVPGELKK